MLHMLLHRVVIDQNVVYVYNHKLIKPLSVSYGQKKGQQLKVRNRPNFLTCRLHATYRWKVLMRATTLLQNSSRFHVCRGNYGLPKLWESQFWEFWDSNLGVPRQNDIWVLALWPGTKITIRGKVVASPSSGHGESCESMFAHGSSVHQKCSNYALTNLLFGLCTSM